MKLDAQTLRRLWPHGDGRIVGLRDAMAESSEAVFAKYGIDTPLLVAHVMAQISHECGEGLEVEENLSYSAARMTQVWPSRFPSITSALPYAKNPRKLGNKVYGGRMGNRADNDDGYNYRGRGASQTTGRDGYDKLGRATGLDLINHPELINDPQRFLECGVADFILCGCLPYAKKDDIRGVTQRLNGGQIGAAERKQWLTKWKAALASAPAPRVGLIDTDEIAPAPVSDGVLRYGDDGFEVKALQAALVDKGYLVGAQDADFGGGTRAAVLAFQADNDLPTTGEVDQATKDALKTAPQKPISEKRAMATVDDLREAGSGTVQKADHLTLWGKIIAALGLGGGGAQQTGILDKAQGVVDQASTLHSLLSSVQDLGAWALQFWWVGALVGGYFAWKFGGDIIKHRLADHRSAANMKA